MVFYYITMKKGEIGDLIYNLGLITQLGLVIVGSLLVGLFFGAFLDRKFGTEGVFLVVFLFLGLISGFYSAYRMLFKKETVIESKKEKGDENR